MYVNVNFSSVKLDHDSELYGEKYQKSEGYICERDPSVKCP